MGSHDIQIRNDEEQARNDFRAFCSKYGYTYIEGVKMLVGFHDENRETFSKQKRRTERSVGVETENR